MKYRYLIGPVSGSLYKVKGSHSYQWRTDHWHRVYSIVHSAIGGMNGYEVISRIDATTQFPEAFK